jgi:sugar lactone lactonase YvrE
MTKSNGMKSFLAWIGVAAAMAWPCSAQKMVLVAGGGTDTNTTVPLVPTTARLDLPFGVDFDRSGNLYLVEMTGQRVRRISRSGLLEVIGGTGAEGSTGDRGPAREARFHGMHNLAVTPGGDLYVADTWNNRVRQIDAASGTVRTIAGTGLKGFGGDEGDAAQAQFGGIYCVSLDPQGENLYLADLDNLRIREVNLKSGRVRTVAGNGTKGVPADGARATNAPLVDPRAVIADGKGRLYILERSGHALRKVDPDGTIQTVVGTGKKGPAGDDEEARQATLNGPKHLCFDGDGNVVIADTDSHVIRKYLAKERRVIRLAGTGKPGAKGLGGSPLHAELNQPHGVYVHADGTLYIADSHNHRVLKIGK